MGYRVDYVPAGKCYRRGKRYSAKTALIALFFLVFCLLVNFLWAEGTEVLRRLVFPGDSVVTMAALEEFTTELRNGADISDSLKQFCIHILEGAGVAAIR